MAIWLDCMHRKLQAINLVIILFRPVERPGCMLEEFEGRRQNTEWFSATFCLKFFYLYIYTLGKLICQEKYIYKMPAMHDWKSAKKADVERF
jgi:hypothetical protein